MSIAAGIQPKISRGRAVAIVLIALIGALLVPASAAYAANGTISGTVTTAAGVPIQGIRISVETVVVNADGTTTWTERQAVPATTLADGSYSASVPPGTQYRVGFHGSGFVPEYYDDALSRETADLVTALDGGATPGVNAALQASRGGVSGTVRNVAGEPVANVPVSVLSLRVEANGTRTWSPVATTATAANGTYLIRDVAPGTYRLGFVTSAYEPRYYPFANNVEEGNDVVIQEGITQANLNVTLVFPGNVKGRILNPDGTAYTGGGTIEAFHEIERAAAPGQLRTYWEVAGSDTTLVNGNYDFYVPGDVYRIRFTLPDGSKGYLPGLSGLRAANQYNVASDASTQIPNLTLPGFGTLSGRVLDGDGDPVGAGAAEIEFYYEFVDQIENNVDIRTWERVRSVPTDATGRFSVRTLPRDYKIRINTIGLGRQFDEYYLDQPATPQGFDDAQQQRVFEFGTTDLGNIFVGDDKRVRNDSVPWVGGAAKAGQVLTAHLGTWTPFDATITFQWLSDGNVVAQGNPLRPTYTIPLFGGAGHRYSIRVTASRFGYTPTTLTSIGTEPAVGVFATAPYENRALPTISGTPETGAVLTAVEGQWSAPPTSFRYQWTAAGSLIPGATGKTFVPGPNELGKKVQVRVDGVLGNQSDYGISESVTIVMGRLVNQVAPSISGTPVVGRQLTANPGTWSATDATYAYQWLADDVAIAGATTSTFTPGEAQIGQRISVRVTASKPAVTTGTAESAKTTPVASNAVTNTALPSISGEPRVGAVLTAAEGSWNPTPTSYGYQWLADGAAITGATQKTYAPVAADEGKALSVRVTARVAGSEDGVATSAPTAPVAVVPVTVTENPSVVGVPRFGRTLVADPGEYAPADVTLVYQWVRNGTGIPGAKARTYKVTGADLGKRISVHVGYLRTGADPVVRTSAATARATSKASISVTKAAVAHGVRLTIDVAAAGVGSVRGLVKAIQRGLVLKSARLQGGHAVLVIRNLSPGRHQIKVASSGDNRVQPARRTVSVTVRR